MSQGTTLLLGFIAGFTILLGLPLGRLRSPAPGVRRCLNGVAVGVLVFLIWDVLAHAWEPIDEALGALREQTGGLAPVAGYGVLFAVGISAGLLSLVAYEHGLTRRTRRFGPGAMTAGELDVSRGGTAAWSPARRLALLIAVGIGMHNFAEGLAIGGSAAAGELSLAVLLVLGFALHNATEGFGIVAPLAGDAQLPSYGFLLGLGVIGGGPTLLGTLIGRQFTSTPVSVLFLTLAAGSMLYVVVQLIAVAAKSGRLGLFHLGMLAGLLAGFGTDMIVTAAGV